MRFNFGAKNGSSYAIGPLCVCPSCLSCLSCPVSNVNVLWPNGWTDQDETWQAGRPRPWPYCLRWGPRSPSPKGNKPQFSAHICCGQMASWIKMPLGRKVSLDRSDIVLDGDPALPPQKGTEPPILGPCLLWPSWCIDQYATWYGGGPRPRPHYARWEVGNPDLPLQKGC